MFCGTMREEESPYEVIILTMSFPLHQRGGRILYSQRTHTVLEGQGLRTLVNLTRTGCKSRCPHPNHPPPQGSHQKNSDIVCACGMQNTNLAQSWRTTARGLQSALEGRPGHSGEDTVCDTCIPSGIMGFVPSLLTSDPAPCSCDWKAVAVGPSVWPPVPVWET